MTGAPMSRGRDEPIVRPRTGVSAMVASLGLALAPTVFAILRRFKPILSVGRTVVVSRYDDVKTVFLSDETFGVPYAPKLAVIMDGKPFFLGMGDTPEYRAAVNAMRAVVPIADVEARIAPAAETAARRFVAQAGGRLDVVDLVRSVTFEVLLDYFGVPAQAAGDLRVWATRLFEFQFADPNDDPALRADVDRMAPALRAHVQGAIEARRASGERRDDVLGRCLDRRAAGAAGYDDDAIRCALVGFIVGGLPQPPMVGPNALDQLLRRPDALASAVTAAREDNDDSLAATIFEAMRFDPLAPVLSRLALDDTTLGQGSARETKIAKGANVLVAFSSAMRDPRRIARPETFDPTRPASDYIHFGYGLHECFGLHINRRLIPMILKPLLATTNLRRAPGVEGKLRKQFVFADRFVVTYDPAGRPAGA